MIFWSVFIRRFSSRRREEIENESFGVVRVLKNYKISDLQVKQLCLKYAITLERKLWIEVLPEDWWNSIFPSV